MLIVKSNIKEATTYQGKAYNVSSDFADALDAKVKEMIQDACRRAGQNNRHTIMPRDL
ncbi:DUF1931 domain-containing protein [Candidatus Woesearchaeota archaeon]|nr:DUF1931 domain-containing protein [Candidatus Woesearchaeota archaeon]